MSDVEGKARERNCEVNIVQRADGEQLYGSAYQPAPVSFILSLCVCVLVCSILAAISSINPLP